MYKSENITGWWFFTNPFEKYAQVKLYPNALLVGVKIKKKIYLKFHHLDK